MADRRYPPSYADEAAAKDKNTRKPDTSGGRTVVIDTGDQTSVVEIPEKGKTAPKRKTKGVTPD